MFSTTYKPATRFVINNHRLNYLKNGGKICKNIYPNSREEKKPSQKKGKKSSLGKENQILWQK